MLESKFQGMLIKEIKRRLPKCIVLKNDPAYMQGIPDLIILNGEHWAMLECKMNKDAPHRPNQEYYVTILDAMSFASFVYPENKEEILDEMVRALSS